MKAVSGRRLVRILEAQGWVVDKIKGSHHALSFGTTRKVVVPVHANRDLKTGLQLFLGMILCHRGTTPCHCGTTHGTAYSVTVGQRNRSLIHLYHARPPNLSIRSANAASASGVLYASFPRSGVTIRTNGTPLDRSNSGRVRVRCPIAARAASPSQLADPNPRR